MRINYNFIQAQSRGCYFFAQSPFLVRFLPVTISQMLHQSFSVVHCITATSQKTFVMVLEMEHDSWKFTRNIDEVEMPLRPSGNLGTTVELHFSAGHKVLELFTATRA